MGQIPGECRYGRLGYPQAAGTLGCALERRIGLFVIAAIANFFGFLDFLEGY